MLDPSRLVFIDETWVKTNMAPLRGWGDTSKRLVAHASYGHWKTMTFMAAMRLDRIDSPGSSNGPINGNAFRAYVETELVATLKPGNLVVLDNPGSHKNEQAPKAIRAARAKIVFLPLTVQI